MSLKRYTVDLAFTEPIGQSLLGLLTAMEATIRNAKGQAVIINPGQPYEEVATKAIWRICYHDEPILTRPPCGPEVEI